MLKKIQSLVGSHRSHGEEFFHEAILLEPPTFLYTHHPCTNNQANKIIHQITLTAIISLCSINTLTVVKKHLFLSSKKSQSKYFQETEKQEAERQEYKEELDFKKKS